jgi:hypothetical protein
VFVTVKITRGSYVIKITFFSFDISCLFFLDQERINSTDSSSSLLPSELLIGTPIPNGNIRHPIKPRTMEQAPLPPEQVVEESSLLNASLNVSSDGDITIAQKCKIFKIYDVKFC